VQRYRARWALASDLCLRLLIQLHTTLGGSPHVSWATRYQQARSSLNLGVIRTWWYAFGLQPNLEAAKLTAFAAAAQPLNTWLEAEMKQPGVAMTTTATRPTTGGKSTKSAKAPKKPTGTGGTAAAGVSASNLTWLVSQARNAARLDLPD
jgi:hypothetical protein